MMLAVIFGMSAVVLSMAMVTRRPDLPKLLPVEVEVASGDKVVSSGSDGQVDLQVKSNHRVVQSSISVVWKNHDSGAMMTRRLTDEEAEKARQMMLAGRSMDEAMLSIPGQVDIMQAKSEMHERSAVSAL